jgi:hypothetical protein
MKIVLLWDVTPCSVTFTDVSEVLSASIIRALIAVMMEVVTTSETSTNFYCTIRCSIPEDSHLHLKRITL